MSDVLFAIIAAALLFASVALWQHQRTYRLNLVLSYKREDLKSALVAADKRNAEQDAKVLARLAAVEVTTGAAVDGVIQRVIKLESGLVPVRRAG